MPKGPPQPNDDKILKLIERKDKEIAKLNRLIQSEQKKIARLLEDFNFITQQLITLDERERDLVEQYYFENERRVDVCSDMEISIRTFVRINNRILDKIREEIDKEA